MKKKNRHEEESQYYIQWAIATIILMVYIIGTLISYNSKMKDLAEERATDRIVRQAIQIRGYYEGKTASMLSMANSLADYMVSLGDDNMKAKLDVMQSFVDEGEFEKVYVIDMDGSAVDNTGKKYATIDNSDEYKDLLDGKRTICVLKDLSGDVEILISAPITNGPARKGYIAMQYKPKDMEKVMSTPIYSYGLLLNSGQAIEIIGSDYLCAEGENLISKMKGMTFKDGSYSIFSQGIYGNRSTSSLVQKENGQSYYVIAQPVEGLEAEVVVIAREEQILRNALAENQYTRKMIIKLIVSLAVFIALLIIIYLINRIAFSKTSQELKSKAEMDLLTGLLNKVSTETKIKEYMTDEGSSKISMMCVLDIDNFKKINDTMGHAFGDEVLSSLGKQIGSEFRVSDIIGRTGGDEFIIFLKDLKTDEIILKEANRVATFFKNFTVGDYTKYSATASIGAAIFPRDGSDFESLYKAADTALYKAKKRGKNQLAFYKDM